MTPSRANSALAADCSAARFDAPSPRAGMTPGEAADDVDIVDVVVAADIGSIVDDVRTNEGQSRTTSNGGRCLLVCIQRAIDGRCVRY